MAMKVKKVSNADEDDLLCPGFEFQPSDEDLVGLYLRKKVEGRPIGERFIRQLDIYQYHPRDLAVTSYRGEKEYYFFCKKATNFWDNIRPIKETGFGFWMATGSDELIFSPDSCLDCIGLRKSLVYYCGAVEEGIQTNWKMHEFRLLDNDKSAKRIDAEGIAQQDPVWTLCRIFNRKLSSRKFESDPNRQNYITNEQHNMGPCNSSLLSQAPHTNNRSKSGNKGIKKTPGSDYGITREILEQHFGKKLEDVASIFNVSKTTLKRILRAYNIPRWPRQAKMLIVSLPHQEFIQQTVGNIGTDITLPIATTMQNDCCITVRVTHKDGIMEFPFSMSSTLMDLKEEVAKRICS